jgi:CDP-diglyceride synthetase
MVKLPTPPWARRRERCPNCLVRLPDDRTYVCDRCGYQLRLPAVSLIGLGAIAAGVGSFLMSAFGGFVLPFPPMPFGLKIPFLENPTTEDLQTLAGWLGALLLFAGTVLAFAGAYAVRRRSERAVRGRPA